MNKQYLYHPLVDLNYYTFGVGPKAMLCFHGYGMHGRQFSSFEAEFGQEYTLYSFDLFFHEQTVLRDNSLKNIESGISKEELIDIFITFCKEKQIVEFSILSYSIGTACAGVLIESAQFKINQAILIAPALLKLPKIFSYLGEPGWKNKRFRQFIYSNTAISISLKFGKLLGYFNSESFPIIKKELGNFKLRHMFYATVTYLRKLRPDIDQLVAQINKQEISIIMVYGKYDHHFPVQIGKVFESQLLNVKHLIVQKGHDMVDAELSNQIRNMM